MRPRRRLLVTVFVAFALVLLGGTVVPVGLMLAQSHRQSYLSQRLNETDSVVGSLRGRPVTDQQRIVFDRYPQGSFTAGWLLDDEGRPIAEPTRRGAFATEPAAAPEVQRALLGPDTRRFGASPEGPRLYLAVPLIEQGALRNVLWISTSLRPVADLDRRSWVVLGGSGVAALIVAIIIGVALAARLSRRVEALEAAAARFGEGRLDEPITLTGRDEVASLAKRLNEMAAGLRKAMAREKDFVSAAAHQIRTPLTTIRLRLEAIEPRLAAGDDETREYLQEMVSEIDRLSELTTKLLEFGAAWDRIGDPVPVDVADAVARTSRRIEAVAARRSVSIDASGDPGAVIRAQLGAFEEVLMNLLDNAVKYSPEGERVTVRWTRAGEMILCTVTDCGPGIALDAMDRIFEPFFSGDRRQGGHGLGLTVSRQVCAASGATLQLAPGNGAGTVAWIEWPAG